MSEKNFNMSILDLLRKYKIDYVKVGDYIYRAFCPFHNDTSKPNLTIYEKTNSFYCFACHAGGGILDFVSLYEGISKEDALMKILNSISYEYIEENLKENKKELKNFNESLIYFCSKKARSNLKLQNYFYDNYIKWVTSFIDYKDMKLIVEEINKYENQGT
jgi:DNA primase